MDQFTAGLIGGALIVCLLVGFAAFLATRVKKAEADTSGKGTDAGQRERDEKGRFK